MLLSANETKKASTAMRDFQNRTSPSRLVVMLSRSRLGSFQYLDFLSRDKPQESQETP
jgi:hypothetical protein